MWFRGTFLTYLSSRRSTLQNLLGFCVTNLKEYLSRFANAHYRLLFENHQTDPIHQLAKANEVFKVSAWTNQRTYNFKSIWVLNVGRAKYWGRSVFSKVRFSIC